MTTLHNRIGYKEFPPYKDIAKSKECYVWHPKGAYVYVQTWKVNQYVVTIAVDLWNISYDVHTEAANTFTYEYIKYLNSLEGRKGVPKNFTFSYGKTYNAVQVMKEDAEEWSKKLWELCSNVENLTHIPVH